MNVQEITHAQPGKNIYFDMQLNLCLQLNFNYNCLLTLHVMYLLNVHGLSDRPFRH